MMNLFQLNPVLVQIINFGISNKYEKFRDRQVKEMSEYIRNMAADTEGMIVYATSSIGGAFDLVPLDVIGEDFPEFRSITELQSNLDITMNVMMYINRWEGNVI